MAREAADAAHGFVMLQESRLAQQLADRLNYADAQGWTYRVQASRGGFYVAVFDQDYHHQGNI